MKQRQYQNNKMEETNQILLKRSVIIFFSLWSWLLLVAIVLILIIFIVVNFTSNFLLLFSFPIPLLNFGTSLFTAFPNWTSVLPSPRAPASAPSSPMARAYTLVPPAPTFMIMIPFIILLPRTASPPMRALFIAMMPIGASTSASTAAVPSPVPSKQLPPQLPEKYHIKRIHLYATLSGRAYLARLA